MSVENKPLVTLQSRITNQTTLISDLGQIKSKVAAFQTALQAVENPLSYSAAVASSSNESAVKVTTTTGANIGSHQITVSQLAKPAQYIFNNFGSSNANVGFANASQFDLTIAGATKSLAVSSTTTIGDLSTWINGLGLGVSASITQTASNQYALMIQGTQSGVANNVTFGVSGALTNPPVSSAAVVASPPAANTSGNQAQDALFTLDNVSFSRTTNIISDVHPGLILNLVSSGSAATINVANGPDNGQEVIKGFITAFNDLAAISKKLTQKGDSSTTAGSLAGLPGAVSFMNQIKSMLAAGSSYNSASGSISLGLYQLGIEIQSDGTLQFNSVKYGSTSNISAILASGINMGSGTFTGIDHTMAHLSMPATLMPRNAPRAASCRGQRKQGLGTARSWHVSSKKTDGSGTRAASWHRGTARVPAPPRDETGTRIARGWRWLGLRRGRRRRRGRPRAPGRRRGEEVLRDFEVHVEHLCE
jgi:flagellar hook-associated protein 2